MPQIITAQDYLITIQSNPMVNQASDSDSEEEVPPPLPPPRTESLKKEVTTACKLLSMNKFEKSPSRWLWLATVQYQSQTRSRSIQLTPSSTSRCLSLLQHLQRIPPSSPWQKKLSRKLIRQKRTTQACHQSYLHRFNSNVKRFLIFKTVDAPDEWSW